MGFQRIAFFLAIIVLQVCARHVSDVGRVDVVSPLAALKIDDSKSCTYIIVVPQRQLEFFPHLKRDEYAGGVNVNSRRCDFYNASGVCFRGLSTGTASQAFKACRDEASVIGGARKGVPAGAVAFPAAFRGVCSPAHRFMP